MASAAPPRRSTIAVTRSERSTPAGRRRGGARRRALAQERRARIGVGLVARDRRACRSTTDSRCGRPTSRRRPRRRARVPGGADQQRRDLFDTTGIGAAVLEGRVQAPGHRRARRCAARCAGRSRPARARPSARSASACQAMRRPSRRITMPTVAPRPARRRSGAARPHAEWRPSRNSRSQRSRPRHVATRPTGRRGRHDHGAPIGARRSATPSADQRESYCRRRRSQSRRPRSAQTENLDRRDGVMAPIDVEQQRRDRLQRARIDQRPAIDGAGSAGCARPAP